MQLITFRHWVMKVASDLDCVKAISLIDWTWYTRILHADYMRDMIANDLDPLDTEILYQYLETVLNLEINTPFPIVYGWQNIQKDSTEDWPEIDLKKVIDLE